MTRVKVGSHAQTYGDGYWFDFFDRWRLAVIFEIDNPPLSNAHYEVMLCDELEKIGADYVTDKEGIWLEFEDDEAATMFVLRWA